MWWHNRFPTITENKTFCLFIDSLGTINLQFLKTFPYIKTMNCDGNHLEFPIDSKIIHLVKDHRYPMHIAAKTQTVID